MITEKDATRMIFRLSKEAHQDFYETCMRKRVSMAYVLREAIKYFIETNKHKLKEKLNEKPTIEEQQSEMVRNNNENITP